MSKEKRATAVLALYYAKDALKQAHRAFVDMGDEALAQYAHELGQGTAELMGRIVLEMGKKTEAA